MIISLIAAYAFDSKSRMVIGKDNKIPWRSPTDMKRFKEYTCGHPIIMGRKTHESIGRLLPERWNIVVSRAANKDNTSGEQPFYFTTIDDALFFAKGKSHEVFVIGGEKIYTQTLPRADRLYLTEIAGTIEGDTFFPDFRSGDFKEIHSEKVGSEVFRIFQRGIKISRSDDTGEGWFGEAEGFSLSGSGPLAESGHYLL